MSLLRDQIEQLRDLIAQVWGEHRDAGSANHNGCDESECAWCQKTREAIQQIALLTAAPFDLSAFLKTWEGHGYTYAKEKAGMRHTFSQSTLEILVIAVTRALSAGETPTTREQEWLAERRSLIRQVFLKDDALIEARQLGLETVKIAKADNANLMLVIEELAACRAALAESEAALTAERSRLREQIEQLPLPIHNDNMLYRSGYVRAIADVLNLLTEG